MAGPDEQPLPGSTTPGVVRVGDTVRRPRSEPTARLEPLLRHLADLGVAPRPLGVDERGRQVLEYVEGETPSGPPYDLTDARLVSSMRLVRRFHDATAGTTWARPHEVVRHGDLGPHNTVYRGERAVRIIDWDEGVRPGSRADDVAHAVWCYADLTEDAVPVREQARRLRLCCSAYGPEVSPADVLTELDQRFERAATQHAAAGRDEAVRVFGRLSAWLAAHREALSG